MKSILTEEQLIDLIQTKVPKPEETDPRNDYHRFMKVTEKGLPRGVYILPISQILLEEENKKMILIIKSLEKFARYCLWKQDYKLLKIFNSEGIDVEGLIKRSPEVLFNYCRIDSIYNGNFFNIIEVNAKRPQIFENQEWINKFVYNSLSPDVENDELTEEIVNSYRMGFEENQKRKAEEIIIFSGFLKYLLENRIKSNYWEMIKKVFDKAKITVMDSGEESAQFLNNAEKIQADLIIAKDIPKGLFSRNGKILNEALRKAYHFKRMEICSPPSARIIGNRLALGLLKEPEWQMKIGLNKAEAEACKIILENRIINKERTAEKIENKKEKYVIKIEGSGGGKGVFLGENTSQEKYWHLFEKYKGKNKLTAQKIVNFGKMRIVDLRDFEVKEAVLTLDPFITNNPKRKVRFKVSGYGSRAIASEEISDNTPRFNPEKGREEILFGTVISYY